MPKPIGLTIQEQLAYYQEKTGLTLPEYTIVKCDEFGLDFWIDTDTYSGHIFIEYSEKNDLYNIWFQSEKRFHSVHCADLLTLIYYSIT